MKDKKIIDTNIYIDDMPLEILPLDGEYPTIEELLEDFDIVYDINNKLYLGNIKGDMK